MLCGEDFESIAADTFLLSAARVIANGPLRAKEASPFVSSKYPVIVRHLGRNSRDFGRAGGIDLGEK